MEYDKDNKESNSVEKFKREDIKTTRNLSDEKKFDFISTDIIQLLSNDENNNLYDGNHIDIIKKERGLIRKLCVNNWINVDEFQYNINYTGMPADLEKEKLKVRKFFIENQATNFNYDIQKLSKLKSLMVEKNLGKIKKCINLMNMINNEDFDYNMRNNVDFFKYIINHPYLKVLGKEIQNEINTKYASIGIEIIKNHMNDNTTYKYSDDNSDSSNHYVEEDYEEDDYMEDEEYYESGDEIV